MLDCVAVQITIGLKFKLGFAARWINYFLQNVCLHGGFVGVTVGTTHRDCAKSAVGSDAVINRLLGTFRFDGSDLMPGAIGAGSFWKGMVNFSGGQSAKEIADEIQKSWDAIRK